MGGVLVTCIFHYWPPVKWEPAIDVDIFNDSKCKFYTVISHVSGSGNLLCILSIQGPRKVNTNENFTGEDASFGVN